MQLAALLLTHSAVTISAAELQPPGGNPPKEVLRVARTEAMRRYRSLVEELQGDTNSHAHLPELVTCQAVVNWLHPEERAWLLLYWVGKAGPRSHTPYSHLSIIAGQDRRVLLSIPGSAGKESGAAAEAAEAQDALMLEMAPGRYALAFSYGAHSKFAGHVKLVSLEKQWPTRELWTCPEAANSPRTHSDIYFTRPPHEKTVAIAVRQYEQIWEGEITKLLRHEFLYRLPTKGGRYAPSKIGAARLSQLLDAVEHDPNTLHIKQAGPIGVQFLIDAEKPK